jgi:hypothetical protein
MTRVTKRRYTVVSIVVALALVVLAHPAAAQGQGFGVRGGLSVDPDQVFIGGHYETAPLVDNVYFKPNLEIGFGEDFTLIALNFEGIYKFPDQGAWRAYAGGGPALNIARVDDDSNSDAGFNLLGGIELERGLGFEVKFGFSGSPDVKFAVLYTFR